MAGRGVRIALAFAVGCLLAPWIPGLLGWGPWAALLAAAVVLLKPASTRLLAAALLGGLWFLAAAQWQLDRQWPAERAGEVLSVTGTLVELPERRDDSVRLVLEAETLGDGGPAPGRILVNWYRPGERLEPGSRWRIQLRLRPPAGRLNPGGFDYQRYLLARRIGAIATVRGKPERMAGRPGTGLFDRQRQRVAEILQAESVSLEAAALKRALGVADRSAMPPELSTRLRETGTAHLLAISGLHVGMVAGVAGLVAGWLATPLLLVSTRFDRRRVAILAGLAAAFGYAALAGFSLPTQRALVILAVAAAALLARRAFAPGHALLLALVAVLLFDPLAPLAAGFWLSFAAVGVLIWAFAWRPGSGIGWLGGLVRAQLVIMVGLLPLNVGLFGQLVPGALAANLVAIPLVGLVVLPALLLDILTILSGLPATGIGAVAGWGLEALLAVIGSIHELGWARLAWPGGGVAALLVAALGAAWLLAPTGWPARWLGALLMLPLLVPVRAAPGPGQLDAWFLDVGDGLAVLVQTADSSLLYDTGPGDGEGGDAIGRILPGLMARAGAAPIERIVVSHARRGHAGGLGSVLDLAPAAKVLSSAGSIGKDCVAGESWRQGDYRFRFLHPSAALPDLGRNSSCVLHVDGPGGSLLLTGGIDAAVEARLAAIRPELEADVLQLPNGGHRDGSSRPFLAALEPRWALASLARFDRYGRIHPETRERLDALGIAWTSTAACGALRVMLRPGHRPEIRSTAGQRRRFWRPETSCP